jgi:hypothetical protein
MLGEQCYCSFGLKACAPAIGHTQSHTSMIQRAEFLSRRFPARVVKALCPESKRLGSASAYAARMADQIKGGMEERTDGRANARCARNPLAMREVAL